ncbi:MAG: hypothetical protein RLZZ221_3023 [Verrucomicrobiota bacterium]
MGSGADVLIAGFAVGGFGNARLLIRAHRGATQLGANDNWFQTANAAELSAVTAAAGAFPLADGSRDSALLASLEPGTYSVIVSGVGNATGTALVEIYLAR